MACTDNDIRRLNDCWRLGIDPKPGELKLGQLLDRLESGEKAKTLFEQWADCPDSNQLKDAILEAALRANDAWRKAAGKEGA